MDGCNFDNTICDNVVVHEVVQLVQHQSPAGWGIPHIWVWRADHCGNWRNVNSYLPIVLGDNVSSRPSLAKAEKLAELAAEHELIDRLCADLLANPSRTGSEALAGTVLRHLVSEQLFFGTDAGPGLLDAAQIKSDTDILRWTDPATDLWDEALSRLDNTLRLHRGHFRDLIAPAHARTSKRLPVTSHHGSARHLPRQRHAPADRTRPAA